METFIHKTRKNLISGEPAVVTGILWIVAMITSLSTAFGEEPPLTVEFMNKLYLGSFTVNAVIIMFYLRFVNLPALTANQEKHLARIKLWIAMIIFGWGFAGLAPIALLLICVVFTLLKYTYLHFSELLEKFILTINKQETYD